MKRENTVIVVSERYMVSNLEMEIRDTFAYASQFYDLHWYSESLTSYAWHMCNFMRRDKQAWHQLAVINNCDPRGLAKFKKKYTGASIIAVDDDNCEAISELGNDISNFNDRQRSIENLIQDIDSTYCDLVRDKSCVLGNNKITTLLNKIKNITEQESIKNIESRIKKLMITI